MAAARPDINQIKTAAVRLRDALRMLRIIQKDSQSLEKSIKTAADVLADDRVQAAYLGG